MSKEADGQKYSVTSGECFVTDTTPVFHEVFNGKDKFSSWEDFSLLFEEFQRVTHSVFKPRSATCVQYVNEKRVTHKIPEKFVYQTVNMICLHFGTRHIRNRDDPAPKRKHGKYIGKDCGACVKLSYKKGCLHITSLNLVHTNHPLIKGETDIQMRRIRPVTFTDDLDLLLCKIAGKNVVYETKLADPNWKTTFMEVQDSDQRLEHVTMRMIKKRLNFLMERFKHNSGGREPLPNDEMGIILYKLLDERERLRISSATPSKRGRKRKSLTASFTRATLKRRVRPRKAAASYEEYLEQKGQTPKRDEADDEDASLDHSMVACLDRGLEDSYFGDSQEHRGSIDMEMRSFFSYWRERDEDERKLRWQEMELRREEMDVRRKEMELQQQKFDSERVERLALVDLLRAQREVVGAGTSFLSFSPEAAKSKSTFTKEFILLQNGMLKPITPEHGMQEIIAESLCS